MIVVRFQSQKLVLLRLILLLSFTSWMAACSLETKIEDLVKSESKPIITVADLTLPENGGPGSLVVSINKPWSENIIVPYQSVAGSATDATDYSTAAGNLTIVAGSTAATITLTPVDDNLYEGSETMKVEFTAPTNASMSASSLAVFEKTVTITDNETQPEVNFAVASDSVAENVAGLSHTILVSLTGPTQAPVTVHYAVTNSGAGGAATAGATVAAGVDYAVSGGVAGGTLTFASGATTASIVVGLNNDTISELTEPAQITLSAPSSMAVLGTVSVHTLSITDDDGTPTVEFALANSSVAENVVGGAQVLSLNLSNPSSQIVTVGYAVTGGTAAGSGADFTLNAGTLTFAPGQTVRTVSMAIVNDSVSELTETAIVSLSAPVNASVGAIGSHTVSITDDDGPPAVNFATATSNAPEGTATHSVVATLTGSSSQDITVNYAVTGGTASGSGVDFTLASGTLTFLAGTTTQTIAMAVVNDTIDESDETVVVSLSSPTNATLGSTLGHTATIVDDDSAPLVEFVSLVGSGMESVGSVTIDVRLSNPSASQVTVNYSQSPGTATGGGVDYTLAAGTLTFAAGETLKSFVFTVVDDNLYENTESISMSLASPVNASLGAQAVRAYFINDNEAPPTIQFSTATDSTVESLPTKNIVVTMSGPSSSAATVDYAVTGGTASGAGVDFTLANGTLTFAAGETTKNITLAIVNDTVAEGDETVVMTLSNVSIGYSLGTSVHTHTIVDDEGPPTVQFAAAVSNANENVGSQTISVTLSSVASSDVTVDFQVTNTVSGAGIADGGGIDYTLANGTLTFTAGQTVRTLVIPVVDDALGEPNEVVALALSNVSGASATLGVQSTHAFTINASDAPTIQYSLATSSANENVGTQLVIVTLSNAASAAVTVDYSVTGGTATGGGVDYSAVTAPTLSFAAGETSKTISLLVVDDNIYEGNETVALDITNASTNASLGSQTTHTFTINDNDVLPTVQYAAATSSANESTSPHTVVINLTGPLSVSSTVDYMVTGGTASGGGVDYTLTNATLIFAAGVTTQTISLPVVNDLIFEGNETIPFNISNPSVVTLGSQTTHTHTIIDDETAPTFQYSAATSNASEAVSPHLVTVTLSGAAQATATVNYAVTGGTATGAGTDFTLASGTLTFAAGVTSQDISISIVNDAIFEGAETILTNLSAPAVGTLGSQITHTHTINDDDGPPTVQFASAISNAGEATTPHSIVVALSGASGSQSTVHYSITGGTATNVADFDISGGNGTLTFAAGVTTQTITFPVVDDNIYEGDEDFELTLDSPTVVTLGSQTTHQHTINDNDTPPTVQYAAATSSENEWQTTHMIGKLVNLQYESQFYSTNSYYYLDTATTNNTTTAPDGTLTAATLRDSDTATGAVHQLGSGYSLIDNEIYTVSTYVKPNTATKVQLGMTLKNGGYANATFDLTGAGSSVIRSGDDLTSSLLSRTIQQEKNGWYRISVTVNIRSGVGGVSSSIVMVDPISDNPYYDSNGANNSVYIWGRQLELGSQMSTYSMNSTSLNTRNTGVATLNHPSAFPVTVNYSVTGGSATGVGTDYALPAGTLTFAAGETTKNILFTVVDDSSYEGNETIDLDLSGAVGGSIGLQSTHTHTIVDNDSVPTVQFAFASSADLESTTPHTVVVSLSNPSASTATVNYSVAGGTATTTTDYSLPAGTLTFAAGEITKTISMSVVNDSTYESDETVSISLSTPSGATLGSPTSHTHTITNDDGAPVISFASGAGSSNENIGTATIPVTLTNASSSNVTVQYSVTGGTAAGGGVDFTLAAGTLTFVAGTTTANLLVPIIDDAISEQTEDIQITLATPTNGTVGVPATRTESIIDNEPLPQIRFASATDSTSESVSSKTIPVTLSGPSSQSVTVQYSVTGGTATGSGTDFTLASGTLTFAVGVTSQNITLAIANDSLAEGSETVIITLATPNVYATIGLPDNHTHTILDDESPPTLQFATSTSSAAETVGSQTIVVTMSGPDASVVRVDYAVTNTVPGPNEATNASDYTLSSGTLTFASGETTKNIVVPVTNDTLGELDEKVVIQLSNLSVGSQTTLGAPLTHTFTILSNDTPTVEYAAATASVTEGATNHQILVNLSGAASTDVIVQFASTGGTAVGTGTDYSILTASPLTITAGSTVGTIVVTTVDDTIFEGDETIILNLTSPSASATLGSVLTHTTTINDNDSMPTVSFAFASAGSTETTAAQYGNFSLSHASSTTILVPYTISGGTATGGGVDYNVAASGTFTFTPGQTTKGINFDVVDDTIYEGNETIIATLGSPTGATLGAITSFTNSILDDETAPTIQFSAATSNTSESTASHVITVTTSGRAQAAATVAYTLSGTASGSGIDYTLANGTFTMASLATIGTISIPVVNDAIYEGDETIVLTLSSPTIATLGTTTVHTHTINDDETQPTLAFQTGTLSFTEADGFSGAYVELSSASASNVVFSYSITGGSATTGVDYTGISGTPTTITIPPGTLVVPIGYTITEDTIDEPDETMTISIAASSGATLGAITSNTTTIVDNDAAPVLSILPATANVAESVGTHNIVVSMTNASSTAIVFNLTLGGTATAGSGADYTLATTHTIPALATSYTLPLVVNDDVTSESAETVIATLNTVTSGTATIHATNKTQTLTITDNDALPFTWLGTSGDGKWSTAANWSTNVVPSASDTARFTTGCGANCNVNVDADVNIGGLSVQGTYAGTITLATTEFIVGGNFNLDGGVLNVGATNLEVYGAMSISGGTFNATTSTMFFGGNFIFFSGTFNAGTSSVSFEPITGTSVTHAYGTISFFDLEYANEVGYTGYTITASGNVTVNGDFYVTNYSGTSSSTITGATFNLKKNVYAASTYHKFSTSIFKINGSTAQSITGNSTAGLSNTEIANTAGGVTFLSDYTNIGNFTYTSGTVNYGTYQLIFMSPNSATSAIDTGTQLTNAVTFRCTTNYENSNFSITTNNMNIGTDLRFVRVAGTQPCNVNGNGLVVRRNLYSELTAGTSNWGGNTAISLSTNAYVGNISQCTGCKFPNGVINVVKSTGSVNLLTDVSLSGTGQDLNVTTGTINQNGFNLAIADVLSTAAGTTINKGCANLTYASHSPALGTINGGSANPNITISDNSQNEGNSSTNTYNFVVSLSAPNCSSPVSFNYATASGTATAGSDYVATSGSSTIASGATTSTIAVTVNGDTAVEGHETFYLNLSSALNGTLTDSQGAGLIQNDDSSGFTWTGALGNNLWNAAGNWANGTVPSATSVVNFAPYACSGANCNVTINANASALGINVLPSYTGTITQSAANTLTTGSGGYVQQSSTASFLGGSGTITIGGPLVLSYGSFRNTSGSIYIYGASGTSTIVDIASGVTYNNNNGVTFLEGDGTVDSNYQVNYGVTRTFDHYILGSRNGSAGQKVRYQFDVPISVNNLTFANLTSTASIYLDNAASPVTVYGDIENTSGGSGGTGQIIWAGTTPKVYKTPTGVLPCIEVRGSSSLSAYNSSGAISCLKLTSGTFVAPTGNLTISTSDTLNLLSGDGSLFTHSSGTVTLKSLVNSVLNIDLTAPITFNHLVVDQGVAGDTTWFFNGDTYNVNGNLSFTSTGGGSEQINSALFNLSGNYSGSVISGTSGGSINFAGSGTQIVSGAATRVAGAKWYIQKSSGTLEFASDVSMPAANQDLDLNNGTINMNGYNLSVSRNLATAAGTTINKGCSTITYATHTPSLGTINGTSSNPNISVNDVSLVEGNSGSTNMPFVISLSEPVCSPFTISYVTNTYNGATAPADYTDTNGTLTIAAGTTTATVNVPIIGETVVEGNETLSFTLSANSHGTITDDQAYGTITNDDVSGYTWTGATGNGLWSTAGNWANSTVPTGTQRAVFAPNACAGANCNVTLNQNISIAGFDILNGYSGTITSGSGYTLTLNSTSTAITMYSGSLNLSAAGAVTIGSGYAYVLGGSVTLPASANISFTGTVILFPTTLVTTGSTVVFNKASGFQSITVGPSLNNVQILSAASAIYIQSTDLYVDGLLTLNNSAIINSSASEKIHARGNISILDGGGTLQNGTATLVIDGSTNQTVTGLTASNYGRTQCNLEIASTGGTVSFVNQFRHKANFTYTSGTVNFGTSFFKFQPDVNRTYDLTGLTSKFGSVEFSGAANANATIVGTMKVSGDLTLSQGSNGQLNGGAIEVEGNVSQTSLSGGTASLAFVGSNAQQWGSVGGTWPGGTVTILKPSNAVTLATAVSLSTVGQDLALTSGTINMNGYNLSINDNLASQAGTVINRNCGTLTYATHSPALATINGSGNNPNITIADVSQNEGASGSAAMPFVVTLSEPVCSGNFTVNWATANNTTNATDLTAASGTLTIAAGSTVGTISSILINGDATVEQDETFFVNLTSNSHGTITDAQAVGTILTDDFANFTWRGNSGVDLKWSRAANWQGGVVPTTQTAIFTGGAACAGANCNPLIDAAVTVGGINMQSTYTGTIAMNTYALDVGTGNFLQDGGTFHGGTAQNRFTGTWTMNAGTFTATSGIWRQDGSTLTMQNSALTFNHNNGTYQTGYYAGVFKTIAKHHFYNVVFDTTGDVQGTISVDGTVSSAGTGSFSSSVSGQIDLYGDLVYGHSGHNGSQYIRFVGTGNQTWTGNGYSFANIEVAKPSGMLNLVGVVAPVNWTYTSGNINFGTASFLFQAYNTWNIFGDLVYPNVTVRGYTGIIDHWIIGGTLLMDDPTYSLIQGPELELRGNINIVASIGGGPSTVKFTGGANQTLVYGGAAADFWDGLIVVEKSGGTLYLAQNLLLDYWAGQNMNFNAGAIDVGSYSLSISNNLASQPGTIFYQGCTGAVTFATHSPAGALFIGGTTPGISIADASLVEGNSGSANMPFVVTLSSSVCSGNLTVNYATSNSTASAGADFTSTSGTLTVSGASTTATINVPILGDTSIEGSETFKLTLSSPVSATLTRAVATGQINNDDLGGNVWTGAAGTNLWSTPGNWADGSVPTVGQDAIFTGGACSGSNCNVTIDTNLNLSSFDMWEGYTGTITQAGSNTITTTYQFRREEGTFIGGTGSITVGDIFDMFWEKSTTSQFIAGNQTITVAGNFTAAPGNFVAGSSTVVLTEGSGTGIYGWSSANPAITFNNLTLMGATRSNDLQGASYMVNGNLNLHDSDASLSYITNGTITVAGNVLSSNYGKATTAANPATIKMIGAGTTITGTSNSRFPSLIFNAPGNISMVGTLAFYGDLRSTGGAVNASGTSVSFNKNATTSINVGNLEFNNVTVNGSSTLLDLEYSSLIVNGNLTWNAGALGNGELRLRGDLNVVTYSISNLGDFIFDGTGNQIITQAVGQALPGKHQYISKNSGVVNLASHIDTFAGQIFFMYKGQLNMNGYNVSIANQLSTSSGTKIFKGCGTLSFGTHNSASGQIYQGNDVTVSIANGSNAEGNNVANVISVSPNNCVATTVDYAAVSGTAVIGSDLYATSSTATIPANTASTTISVPTMDDNSYEPAEYFTVVLSNLMPGTRAGSIVATDTISDNDLAPVVQFTATSQTVSESVGSAVVTLTIGYPSAYDIIVQGNVSGTALGGSDYATLSPTYTLPAGYTVFSYSINITDDALSESNETIILTGTSATNATLGVPASHTITITDNDQAADPTLSLTDATSSSTLYSDSAVVNVAIANDAGAAKWCLSETQTSKPANGTVPCTGGTGPASGWTMVRPTSFTFSAGEGPKTVYVWVADGSNVVNNGPISDTITIDTVAPTAPTFVSPAAQLSVFTPNYNFDWWSYDVTSGVATYTYNFYNTNNCTGTVIATATTSSTTYNPTLAKGSNSLSVVATDGAGLSSAASCSPKVTYSGYSLTKDTSSVTSTPVAPIQFGGLMYFAGSDAVGPGLFKTDGTAGGTVLVKRFDANTSNSVSKLTAGATKFYFIGFTEAAGYELYVSDGTSVGTTLVADLSPGRSDGLSSGDKIVVLGDIAIFSPSNASEVYGQEIWRSDGTSGGTYMLKDINTGVTGLTINSMAVAGSKVFFNADDQYLGDELYMTDGTPGGTVLVKDIEPGSTYSSPSNFVVSGSTLYFSAVTTTSGTELWKSDGTAAGTVMVKDINPGTGSSGPTNGVIDNGILYFSANDGTNGTELWRSDGTSGGTYMLGNIASGSASSSPSNIVVMNGSVYMQAQATTAINFELYKVNILTQVVSLVKDISTPASTASYPSDLFVYNNTLYFSATTSTNGKELWKSDGTSGGTSMVTDLISGALSGVSGNVRLYNSKVFMYASNGTYSGIYLSDGTGAGTTSLAASSIGIGLLGTVTNQNGVQFGNYYYFAANDGVNGNELWRTDGTTAGTSLFKDIESGSGSSSPSKFTVSGGKLYFVATTAASGQELWVSDGTSGGTVLVREIGTTTTGSSPSNLTDVGGVLFFSATTSANGNELWKSTDGTSANTTLVRDICTSPGASTGSSPSNFAVVNGMLVFSATNGASVNGVEPWVSDGTSAGTTMLMNIAPTTASSSPSNFTVVGTTAFFTATNAAAGLELYKTDGTAGGTALVKDIFVGATGSGISSMTGMGGNLYFNAQSVANNNELWKSDGTSAGTVLLKEINYSASSSPTSLVTMGSNVYFQANDGLTGYELWKTDGTANGTVMIGDLNAGSDSSIITNMIVQDNALYMSFGFTNTKTMVMKYEPGTSALPFALPTYPSTIPAGSAGTLVRFNNGVMFIGNVNGGPKLFSAY